MATVTSQNHPLHIVNVLSMLQVCDRLDYRYVDALWRVGNSALIRRLALAQLSLLLKPVHRSKFPDHALVRFPQAKSFVVSGLRFAPSRGNLAGDAHKCVMLEMTGPPPSSMVRSFSHLTTLRLEFCGSLEYMAAAGWQRKIAPMLKVLALHTGPYSLDPRFQDKIFAFMTRLSEGLESLAVRSLSHGGLFFALIRLPHWVRRRLPTSLREWDLAGFFIPDDGDDLGEEDEYDERDD